MKDFLLANNIIPSSQHIFLPGRSAFTNLLSKFLNWTLPDDRSERVYLYYVDFKRAFDRVPFEYLLHKLDHGGIGGNLLSCVQAFIQDRYFKVRICNSFYQRYEVFIVVSIGNRTWSIAALICIGALPAKLKTKVTSFTDD